MLPGVVLKRLLDGHMDMQVMERYRSHVVYGDQFNLVQKWWTNGPVPVLYVLCI